MSLDYTYLQVLPDRHQNPCESQEEVEKELGGKKKEEKEEKTEVEEKEGKKAQLVLPIFSLEHGQILDGQPIKKRESFPTYTPTRSHQLWRAALQHPYHNF